MVGGNSGPATAVDASPVVEQLVVLLEKHFVSPQKQDGRTISRWRRILTSYHNIRELVTIHDDVMTTTNLQLYELNQTTLMKWYDKFNKCTIKVSHNQYLIIYSLIYYKLRWNNRQKTLEKKILLQALPQPPPRAATKPLPPAKPLLPKPLPTPPTPHTFITIPTLPTKTPTQQQLPSTPTTSSTQIYNSPTTIPVPRTTEYRHRKRQEQEEPEAQTGKFANCAPEIRIFTNFCASDIRFCAPRFRIFALYFFIVIFCQF